MALTQISTGVVKDDAGTAGKIPANAVGSSEIADDAVTAAKIADDAIGQDQLAENAVVLANLTNDCVSGDKIADEAIAESRLEISNAGTNGQYLQKQSGNTGGLTWADVTIPPGGNTVDLVADGAIAAGKPVVVKSNGKAAQVSESLVGRAINTGMLAGSLNSLNHNNGSLAGCFSSGQGKWVTWHVNNDDSSKPWVTCWRKSGDNAISKDEVSAFSHIGDSSLLNDNEYRPSLTYDVNADKVVGIYRKSHPNNQMGAWCGTVPSTNTTITFGSAPITAHADDSKCMDIEYDPDAQKCIAVFTDEGDSNKGKSVVLTTTGSGSSASISASSAVTFDSGTVEYKCLAYDTVNDKMLVFYRGASNYIYARVGSISGTTMSWGSATTIVDSSTSAQLRVAYGNGVTALVYNRSSDIRARLISYNGSAFTVGSEVTVDTIAYNDEWPEVSYDSGTNYFLIAKRIGTNAYRCYMCTNSGTTLTIGNGISPGNDSGVGRRIYIANPTTGQALLVYDNNSPARVAGRSTIVASQVSNLGGSSNNMVGFAAAAINDGATGTINTYGNTVDHQSGLSAGTAYYVTGSGALTNGASGTVYGGLALSATKLLIQRGG